MDPDSSRIEIRKYPNRRFYNATHSKHVTLSELHALVCSGHDLTITDSRNGTDITNVVLTQILIERDADKLALLPSEVLHQIIRTQAGRLGSVFEGFLRRMIDAQRTSQAQWSRFLQNTLGLGGPPAANPFDWTRSLMGAFQHPHASPPATPAPEEDHTRERDRELMELCRQLAELSQRMEELSREAGDPTEEPPA